MYTRTNFKTKKALKDAVAKGDQVECYSPGPFGCPSEGRVSLEGPHYPKPHKWYATAWLKNGYIMKGSVK